MKITDWPLADRPREKMMANGEVSLTDSELLAILINTGREGKTAVEVARDILSHCNDDLDLLHYKLDPAFQDPKETSTMLGIGPAKSCTIRAALELGRRMKQQQDIKAANAVVIDSSEKAFALMDAYMSALDHEEMWAIYTSKNGKVRQRVLIGLGGTDAASADIKKIVRPAIQYMASGVLLCHNHPHSGLKPSQADRKVTDCAREALRLFNVNLLDHLIIADHQYYSMHDNGMI